MWRAEGIADSGRTELVDLTAHAMANPCCSHPLVIGDLHVFPAYIKVGCAYRLYPSWPWRCRCQVPSASDGCLGRRGSCRASPPPRARRTQSPGFPRSASEYAAWPADAAAGSGSDRQDGHSARPPANAATVTGRNGPPRGRVVTRRQSHGTDEAGVCPGNRLTNAGSAPGTRCPASNPSPGEDARSEHTYGGPTGRRCCTFLLYPLFESFELRF